MLSIVLTEAAYYILLSFLKPMHGYGIIQNVFQLSNGRVHLAAGTLYGAINTLLEKGWIIALSCEGYNRRKGYVITDFGLNVLKSEYIRLNELVDNGTIFLGGKANE